jgi:trimeric autotransporter adhesin
MNTSPIFLVRRETLGEDRFRERPGVPGAADFVEGYGQPLRSRRRVPMVLLVVGWLAGLWTNTAFAQGALTNGWMHTGTIAPIGDSDTWTFSASSGDTIVVKVGEITQTNTFNPRIRLLNPGAVQMASASAAVAAEIAVTATNTGTFTVIVDDAVGTSATGTYRLTLAKSPGAVFVAPGDEGGPLTNGVSHQGNLPPGDLDVWTFSATNGESIAVKVGQISETNNFDPWMRLYGPDGVLLGSVQAVWAAEVATRATNTGTFTVVIANYPYYSDAASGTYRLKLAKTGSPFVVSPGDEGGPLTNGVAHQGNLPLGDLDLWSFSATTGDAIVIKVGQMSDTNNFDPWVRLYGPDGALLDSAQAVSAAEVEIRATNSGTFLAVIGNYPYYSDAASGTYRLTLAKTGDPIGVSAGDEGGPLTNGLKHSGTISVGDLDIWNFAAGVGQSIVVAVGQVTDLGNFDPWVRLYGPDGVLLGSDFGFASAEVTLRATNNGTFTVVIANNSYTSDAGNGTYEMTLAQTGDPIAVSAGDEGGPLTNGVLHTGAISVGDLDVWSFAAKANESVVVRVGQVTDLGNFDPWVRLYGPDGALLGSDFAAAVGEVTVRATNSGTFLVVIGNSPYNSDAGNGTYLLTLAKTGDPAVVAPGDEGGPMVGAAVYGGDLPVGDLDVWTFTSCPGEAIHVRVDELSQTNSFDPWVRVYGPNGVLLGSSFGTTFGEVNLTATNRGVFTVLIANSDYNNNAGSGTYQLSVNELSSELRLCPPTISGTNLNLSGVGGASNATFVVFTHTNVAVPRALWAPLLTNQFDQFGLFTLTNRFDPAEPRRFFTLEQR